MACSSTNSGYLNIRRLLVDFCWAMSFKLTFGVFGYCCNYCCGPGNCCYYCCYYKSDYYCCYCYCKSDYYCCYYCYYYYYYYHCCYYYYYCCSRSLLNSSSGSPNSSSFFSNLIDPDPVHRRQKRGVTTMVGPIGINHPNFCNRRFPLFCILEITLTKLQVSLTHR